MSKDTVYRQLDSPTETAWSITAKLIAGMAIYGGLGWVLSVWFGHAPAFIAVGLLVGLGLSMYLVLMRLRHETNEIQHKSVGAGAK